MESPRAWLYPDSYQEATEAQRELAQKVVISETPLTVRWIAGLDVSNNLESSEILYAAAVVLSYPELEVVETATVVEERLFPYIPGLLGFREVPALIKALEKLQHKPDLVIVDGQGISHPRGLGVASHVGVLMDLPAIGVAKSILVGKPEHSLSLEVGSSTRLLWKEKLLGFLYRSKLRSKPVIISPGHRLSPEQALDFVKTCFRGYKLPEPTRQAHRAANECRQAFLSA